MMQRSVVCIVVLCAGLAGAVPARFTVDADGVPGSAEMLSGPGRPEHVMRRQLLEHRSEKSSAGKIHVVYSADGDVVPGLKASIASCIASSASPSELVIHVMVQSKHLERLRRELSIESTQRITSAGAVISLHEIPTTVVEADRGKIPIRIRQERGELDDPEVYARIYMDKIIPQMEFAVWLDADTIVQKDVKELQKRLQQSGKTIGFVSRSTKMYPNFLTGKCAPELDVSWSKLKNLTAYNTGVFAVNLERWAAVKAAARIEKLVRLQNSCPGGLWKGGSQPPLTLAFQLHDPNHSDDFIVFEKEWNALGFGLDQKNKDETGQLHILHWNGMRKPWKSNGYNKAIWEPYYRRYDHL
ncbi:putative galacturonosyltransferase-like 7 [Symbiodinium microadriaticum]|uniref:Putative galacturonosyltransferase-like 7 n=1 Tax=Symbiodinium microadriaticum TaxID=2951 RepID=A0A1Q9DTG0_SYMMI|nr:putative galacturonosyltransferase-like 7 [Symbiodinium microadriaticum]CAE7360600.1 GATL7 [Symbiodinium microadriaticum]CAE7948462.1 GATL7 [Symbiodinium sp. KB8]